LWFRVDFVNFVFASWYTARMESADRKARIIELGRLGTAPYEIARVLTLEFGIKVSSALVYYHLGKAGLWKKGRVGERRQTNPNDPYRARVDGILAKVDGLAIEVLEGTGIETDLILQETILRVDDLPPPPQPRRGTRDAPYGDGPYGDGSQEGPRSPDGRTLDQIDATSATDEDLEWLRWLRRSPDGTVTDRLRATEAILKWRRQGTDDSRKRLDDDQLVTLLGDIIVSLPESLRQRVLAAATAAYQN